MSFLKTESRNISLCKNQKTLEPGTFIISAGQLMVYVIQATGTDWKKRNWDSILAPKNSKTLDFSMNSLFAPLKSTPPRGLFAPLQTKPVIITTQVQNRVLYLSGRIELLSLPCGERLWFGLRSDWYRRLDSDAYLWLFNRFWSHYEAHGLKDETMDLPERFRWVKEQGIVMGSFTSNQVADGRQPRPSFRWKENYPSDVDRDYF